MKLTIFRLVALAALLALVLPSGGQAAGQGPVNPGSASAPSAYDRGVYLPLIGRDASFLPPLPATGDTAHRSGKGSVA